MDNILEVRDLNIFFGKKQIVRNVNFNVLKNSVTAILGPSGSGKTSILHCINRLISDGENTKISGEILFKGENILHCQQINILRKNIAMLFQNPAPLPFSIEKNLRIVKEEWNEDIQAEEVLKVVGLWDEIGQDVKRKAMALSGGQKQRLCLARALMSNPEILLLDEPCSSLDPISTKNIEDLMRKLKQSKSIVFVTHDIHQAKRIADNVVFIWPKSDGGRVVEATSSGAFFSENAHPITQSYLAGEFPDASILNLD